MQVRDMLSAFPRLHVLTVGDAFLDEFVIGTPTRLCRERPVPVLVRRAEHAFPGGAANAAANIRALGAQASFVSALGLEETDRRIRELLRARDVSVECIVDAQSARAGRKRRIIADDHYVARVDDEPSGFEQPDVQREIVARLRDTYERADAVLLSDYGGGCVGTSVVRALAKQLEERRVRLVVDARDPRRYAELTADVVTPNLEEAALFMGVRTPAPHDRNAVEALTHAFARRVGAGAVAITLGGAGVFVVTAGGGELIAGRRVAVNNTCGAGDSFAAALTLSLAAGAHILEAARLALEAAAVAVAKPYTATVSLAELRERLELLGSAAAAQQMSPLDDVAIGIKARRARDERIVLTNGVFDLLHAGHVGLLQRARSCGDVLIVALNSDRSASLIKGPDRPIASQSDRRAVLLALDCVDEVVIFDGLTAEDVIETLRPDIYVRGDDWPTADLPEARAAERIGADVVLLPRLAEVTTSVIINRITARAPSWSPVRS